MRQAVSLLQRAGSSYLPPFLSLRDTIMHEAAVAEDNLAALGCLEEPCLALHKAMPQVSRSKWELQAAAVPRTLTRDNKH